MRLLDPFVLRRDEADGSEGGGGTAVVDPPAQDNAAKLAELESQINALKQQHRDAEESARYWHEQAKSKPAKEEKPAAAAAEEDDIDPIELLSKKGAAGLDELLAKRGFVKATDVNQTVSAAKEQLVQEAELARQYPDIKNPDSEFFKTTARHYAELTKNGLNQGAATVQACRAARLELLESGKVKTQAEIQEREDRAAAAGGDKSRGKGSAKGNDDADETLTPYQKTICAEMCPEGMKIEDFEAAYIKRAKAGIDFRVR